MTKFNQLGVVAIIISMLFVACEVSTDDTSSSEEKEVNLTISNVHSGSIDISWSEIEEASWYIVELVNTNNSDDKFTSAGIQDSEYKLTYSSFSLTPGETYTVSVEALDYLSGGKTVGKGNEEVSIPSLPSDFVGIWNYSGNRTMEFKSDGTLDSEDYSPVTKTWTISNGQLIIISHHSSNKQFETYDYTFSDNNNTLQLDNKYSSMMSYTLSK